jgi:NADH-quinone oxidoreductase subunit L
MLFHREPIIKIAAAYSHEEEAHGHGHGHGHDEHHGVPWVMNLPLLILAFFTLTLGFMQGPLEKFLTGHAGHHDISIPLLVSAVSAALGGIGLAWLDWGAKNAKCVGFISRVPVLENFFIQKWYMDHFWRWFLNTVIYGTFSKWFTFNDRRIVDGGVDAVAFSTVGGGRFLSRFQTALLQLNLLFMVLVVAGVGLYVVMGR